MLRHARYATRPVLYHWRGDLSKNFSAIFAIYIYRTGIRKLFLTRLTNAYLSLTNLLDTMRIAFLINLRNFHSTWKLILLCYSLGFLMNAPRSSRHLADELLRLSTKASGFSKDLHTRQRWVAGLRLIHLDQLFFHSFLRPPSQINTSPRGPKDFFVTDRVTELSEMIGFSVCRSAILYKSLGHTGE